MKLLHEIDPHVVAWRLGAQMFGYDHREMFLPTGLLVGEAPGPRTNPLLPLFPHPENSSGARLLGYSNLPIEEFLGRLRRENLWNSPFATETDPARRVRELLRLAIELELRVLLLGRRVRDAFGCTQDCGTATLYLDSVPVQVGWIPHPSGLNRWYNDYDQQSLAGSFVRWAAGGATP